MSPTFGSVFSGIEGIGMGLEAAGFECKWQIEFDPQCVSVLERHWPKVKRHGDITKVKGKDLEEVNLIVGGWPCQDLSVAGKRGGLAGQRSGLFFEFMRLVDELNPEWLLAENVPGLLSAGCKPACPGGCVKSHGGAMGTVVGSLADRGYGFAWRCLDAQFFGVPQRRRRVFLVGHLGTPWSAPAKVLFDNESLQGDPPTRRAKGKDAASGVEGCTEGDHSHERGRTEGTVAALSATGVGVAGPDDNQAQAGHLIVPDVAGTLGGGSGKRGWSDDFDRSGAFIGYPDPARALLAVPHGQRIDFESETLAFSVYPESGQGADIRVTEIDIAPALSATAEAQSTDRGVRIVESFSENQRAELRTSEISPQLTTGGGKPGQGYPAVHQKEEDEAVGMVRRLTPLECERLQGFPDNHTAFDRTGKKIADSVRYRMIGNAVAVPVSTWIGHRLLKVIEDTWA